MFEKEAKEAFKKRYPNNIAINSYYVEGFKDCAKSRLNVTTISDCPIKDVQELQKKLAGSKMENDCKFAFNGLATFVDWYAENKEQKERYMNDILLLVNKMEKLPKEIE